MYKHDLINQLSKLLPHIKQSYFVASLGLFGSYARNEQSNKSDVDLLVEFQRPVGWEFFELKTLLESTLKKNVDLVTKKALKKSLRKTILDEVIFVE